MRNASHRRFAPWSAGLLCVSMSVGCTCGGPSEESLPASRANPVASGRVSEDSSVCPQRFPWAGELRDDVELELLHGSGEGEKAHGAGYRLYRDGRFETYDVLRVEKNDAGKVSFKRVAGSWAQRGTIKEDALAKVRQQLAEMPEASLRGKWRTSGPLGALTHLTTRRDGVTRTLCYVGQEPPASVEALEKRVTDLVNQLR